MANRGVLAHRDRSRGSAGDPAAEIAFTIRIPIYECKVKVIVAPEIGGLMRKLDPKTKQDDEEMVKGIVISDHWPVIYVLIKAKWFDTNTVMHESLHVTTSIMQGIGCTLSDDSEEAYAYLNAYIGVRMMRRLTRGRNA